MTNFSDQIYYLKVKPVSASDKRPLWSVVIPTYNCTDYLKETLSSVLEQDLGKEQMEIIVVDDHSTKDNPEEVVLNYGKERVKFIRQNTNLGQVKNYETGLKVTKGHYIHLLHGDDKVRPGFYRKMEYLFHTYKDIGAAFCRSIYIDQKSRWISMTSIIKEDEGIVDNISELLYVEQCIQTPSIAVKREVYETIGTFDRRLDSFEDWEMWNRIANSYKIATTPKVLAEYRIHNNNATHITLRNGSAVKTQNLACEIIDSYIDTNIKNRFYKLRNQKQANFLLNYYIKISNSLSYNIKRQFVVNILKLNCNLKNFYHLVKHFNR